MRTTLNLQPTIIYGESCTVFGDKLPSFGTVVKWFQDFCEGQVEINDETRPGRPFTTITSENIEEIQSIINILQ